VDLADCMVRETLHRLRKSRFDGKVWLAGVNDLILKLNIMIL